MAGSKKEPEIFPIIHTPHTHDVLCGRGGLTNQHAGNEWFRRLVRSNRALYRSCPKHTKLLVAKAIVQAVQQQEPPGRFLELADKDSGSWRQITYKRAVDKTSQALREKDLPGDPKIPGVVDADPPLSTEVAQLAAQAAAKKTASKNEDLSDLAKAALRQAGLDRAQAGASQQPFARQQMEMDRKRKAEERPSGIAQPSWWRQGNPPMGGYGGNNIQQRIVSNDQDTGYGQADKRMKPNDDDIIPLPPESVQSRQSSLFGFFSGSGFFGRTDSDPMANSNQMEVARNRRSSGFFSFSGGARNSFMGQQQLPNPSDVLSMEAAAFEGSNLGNFSFNPQQSLGLSSVDPLPVNGVGSGMNMHQNSNKMHAMHQQQNGMYSSSSQKYPSSRNVGSEPEEISTYGLVDDDVVPLPLNRLTTQVSDWLTSFWPLNKDQEDDQLQPHQQEQQQQQEEPQPPPPPAENLERGISSSIFNLARTPSQFLTTLKSGVTSMLVGEDFAPAPLPQSTFGSAGGGSIVQQGGPPIMGTASKGGRDSLLDDYEETPLETRLRTVNSR